ncbi:MAG: hypothetical protein ACYC4Q_02505 [Victivallaceae bacterium]
MDLKRRISLLGLAIAQFIKFMLILAIIGDAGYGIYFAWTKFIKQSSATVSSAGSARTEKVLNPK